MSDYDSDDYNGTYGTYGGYGDEDDGYDEYNEYDSDNERRARYGLGSDEDLFSYGEFEATQRTAQTYSLFEEPALGTLTQMSQGQRHAFETEEEQISNKLRVLFNQLRVEDTIKNRVIEIMRTISNPELRNLETVILATQVMDLGIQKENLIRVMQNNRNRNITPEDVYRYIKIIRNI